MKKRLLTSLEIILVLVAAFVLKVLVSPYFFDALVLFVAVVACLETSRLLKKMGNYNYFVIAIIMPIVLMASTLVGLYFDNVIGLTYTLLIDVAIIILGFGVAFLCGIIDRKKTFNEMKIRKMERNTSITRYSFNKAFNTSISFIYPAFLLMFITVLNHLDGLTATFTKVGEFGGYASLVALIFMILIPVITDTFAYLNGMLFGKTKLMPTVSPNKTIAGAIGGIVWCVLLSICTYLIMNAIEPMSIAFASAGFKLWQVAIISLIGSVICQAGDLLESFFKRKAETKDSGKILPGHGGMLDQVDSYIFLAPYLVIVFTILLAII